MDTSAWIAYANRGEQDHGSVSKALESWKGRLLTTNFVFDEAVTLLGYSFRHDVAVCMGQTLLDSSVVNLLRVSLEDERAAWELFRQREDKSYSFTDCTSFVLMRRLGIREAVTLDEDFRREGFQVRP
ncbi:MAG: PIN domain-containing protein [Planctomycetota bacterium]|nr:PIN domain-containing protein [Planctomycetota bacterium]